MDFFLIQWGLSLMGPWGKTMNEFLEVKRHGDPWKCVSRVCLALLGGQNHSSHREITD